MACCLSSKLAFDSLRNRAEFAAGIAPKSEVLYASLATYCAIFHWIRNEPEQAYSIIKGHNRFVKFYDGDLYRMEKIFLYFLFKLIAFREKNESLYAKVSKDDIDEEKTVYVIGESHSLTAANISAPWVNSKCSRFKTRFIMGAKMYHCGDLDQSPRFYQGFYLAEHLSRIPGKASILITIGEIDSRPNEGIWKFADSKVEVALENAREVVQKFVHFIKKHVGERMPNSVTIQGVPKPNYSFEGKYDPVDKDGFLEFIGELNVILRTEAHRFGFNFLDVYVATSGTGQDLGDSPDYHIDNFHLKPSFYLDALKYLVEPSDN